MPSKTTTPASKSKEAIELPGDSKHLREAKEKLNVKIRAMAEDIASSYKLYQEATTLVEMRQAIGPLLTTLTQASRDIPPLHITFERELRIVEGA